MHIVDKNYIALFDHGIKMLVTYQLYILDPRFVPRLYTEAIEIQGENARKSEPPHL